MPMPTTSSRLSFASLLVLFALLSLVIPLPARAVVEVEIDAADYEAYIKPADDCSLSFRNFFTGNLWSAGCIDTSKSLSPTRTTPVVDSRQVEVAPSPFTNARFQTSVMDDFRSLFKPKEIKKDVPALDADYDLFYSYKGDADSPKASDDAVKAPTPGLLPFSRNVLFGGAGNVPTPIQNALPQYPGSRGDYSRSPFTDDYRDRGAGEGFWGYQRVEKPDVPGYSISNYRQAIEYCDGRGYTTEEDITRCQIDIESDLNWGVPIESIVAPISNYRQAIEYCDGRGYATEEEITGCQIDVESRLGRGWPIVAPVQEGPSYGSVYEGVSSQPENLNAGRVTDGEGRPTNIRTREEWEFGGEPTPAAQPTGWRWFDEYILRIQDTKPTKGDDTHPTLLGPEPYEDNSWRSFDDLNPAAEFPDQVSSGEIEILSGGTTGVENYYYGGGLPNWDEETSAKPTRQFSNVAPSSPELANQSLVASAFGAFFAPRK